MSENVTDKNVRYVILAEKNPDNLSLAVSALMDEGWQLHGELKLQTMADGTSLTFASVVYIQAMWRNVRKPRPRTGIVKKPSRGPEFY